MAQLTRIEIRAPYLVLIGDTEDPTYAKTGYGLVHWQPERVLGQLRFPGCGADLGVPDMDIAQARALGAQSLVIGVAPAGGVIPRNWYQAIEEAARAGLDIVCGLHIRLHDLSGVVEAAKASGARLIDVRVPPSDIPVASGRKRSGYRLLTVGTDCAIGKKYAALGITRAMQAAGIPATFRATGQTGIMLAGEGIPIDSVVADFIAGAAEVLSPDNEPGHWDVIEGQGTLFHPAYSGVALGLLHGSQPDAFVVCHEATRTRVSGWEEYTLPSVGECIERHLELGRRTNPGIRCVGVSVNTSGLLPAERETWLADLAQETGLPCIDPLIDGCDRIVEGIQTTYGVRAP